MQLQISNFCWLTFVSPWFSGQSVSFDRSEVKFLLKVIRWAEAVLGASCVQLLKLIDSDSSRWAAVWQQRESRLIPEQSVRRCGFLSAAGSVSVLPPSHVLLVWFPTRATLTPSYDLCCLCWSSTGRKICILKQFMTWTLCLQHCCFLRQLISTCLSRMSSEKDRKSMFDVD